MKKILSVVLAIIMLAACVPMVSAATATDDELAFVTALARYDSNMFSYYNVNGEGKRGYEIDELHMVCNKIEECTWWEPLLNTHSYKTFVASLGDGIDECIAELNGFCERTEESLENAGYTKVINIYSTIFVQMRSQLYYDDAVYGDFVIFTDKYLSHITAEYMDEMQNEMDAECDALIERFYNDPASVTQAEYDTAVEEYVNFMHSVFDCFEGEHKFSPCTDLGDGNHKAVCTFCTAGELVEAHTWGEYIPDDNGTTATAKCEKCDATDVIEVEWADLPAEDDSNFFTMLIATLKDIFAKITEFFQKLFG